MNYAFPAGPVVKDLPCNAGDVGLISGRGTKTPQASEQLSPHPATAAHVPPQKTPHDMRKMPRAAAETPRSQRNKQNLRKLCQRWEGKR